MDDDTEEVVMLAEKWRKRDIHHGSFYGVDVR